MDFRANFEPYFTYSTSITQNGITVYRDVEWKYNLGDLKAGDRFTEIIIDHTLKLEKGWQKVKFCRNFDLDFKFLSKNQA